MMLLDTNDIARRIENVLMAGAPIGNTNASKNHVKQTETPEFKKWFGDSKVVDADGKPLRVYHGGSAENEFRPITFLTEDKEVAKSYAKGGRSVEGNGGIVHELYASINNPLNLSDITQNTEWSTIRETLKSSGVKDETLDEIGENFTNSSRPGISGIFDDNWATNPSLVVRDLKDYGFDGLRIKEDGKPAWVAFHSTQIKSAIGNSGKFDPKDPRITSTLASRINRVLAEDSTAPVSPNQQHAAAAVLRAARLVSVGNWLAEKMQGRVDLMQKQVAKDIMQHAQGFSEASLSSLFAEYERAVNACFDWMHGELTDDLKQLSEILSDHNSQAVSAHFGSSTAATPPSDISALNILGAPLADHFEKMASDTLFRLKVETRKAVDAGCTAAETVKRLGLKTEATVTATIRAGDVPGHEFHGNQYTDAVTGEKLEGFKPWTMKQTGSDSQRTGVAQFDFDKPSFAKNPGNHRLFLVSPRSYALTMQNAPLMESIRKNPLATEHLADGVKVLSFRDKEKAIEAAKRIHAGDISASDLAARIENVLRAEIPNPLSAINIGINLFDATDNSLMKFLQAAMTALAADADEDSIDDDTERNMGWTWITAGDANVCPICEFYGDGQWDSDLNPVGDSPELADGKPPLHFGDRCAFLPCDLDEPDSEPKDFSDYLAHYSGTEQREAFGEANLNAYRRGEMTPAQLMGQQTNRIPLDKFRDMSPVTDFTTKQIERVGQSSAQSILDRRKRNTMEALGLK